MTLTANSRRKIAIIGGGAAGLRVASQIFRAMRWPNVTLVEPSTWHVYEPLLPWLAVGLAQPDEVTRPLCDLLPTGIHWARQDVKKLDLKKNTIELESGREESFEFLVWASSLEPEWKSLKGVEDLLGKGGVCNVHTYQQALATQKQVEQFEGGQVVFAMMSSLKGDEEAQRFMLLLDDMLRRKGLREKSTVTFVSVRPDLFPTPDVRKKLEEMAAKKDIKVHFQHQFKSIDPETRTIVFDLLNEKGKASGETLELNYDLLHVTPPMVPSAQLAKAKLAARTGDDKGLLSLDQHTLQHKKQKNIFGIGDSAALPTIRTDSASAKQAPVVVHNLLATLKGKGPGTFHKYDGYASVSLSSSHKQALLAAFDYEHESRKLPLNGGKESFGLWYFDRHLAPSLYWRAATKGLI